MLLMASFPHIEETLRGDEVKETESRDGREGGRERGRATERLIVLFWAHAQKRFPCMAPETLIHTVCCIITCVKALNERTSGLSLESRTDGL